jgi:hypothetical protein
MDGSDDYFLDDDIVLDDQTLAVLDSAEQKYLTQAVVPPPPKRQKTDNGWKAVSSRATVADDHEDLPEISVHGDGSYTLRGSTKVVQKQSILVPHASTSAIHAPVVALPQQRVALTQQRVSDAPTASLSTMHTRPEPPSRPRDQPTTRTRVIPALERAVAPDTSMGQAEELRKQIEEVCPIYSCIMFPLFNIFQLQRENQKYRADLKNATDAKFQKQGEVAILRERFDKVFARFKFYARYRTSELEQVAQEHATQVANLKLAKEESEAKQLALQKEMKAEMERLKTQFIFKAS